MLNNIRSDCYRLCKGKALYVAILSLCIIFFIMQSSNGMKSNTNFASYDANSGTLLDFLYYFPKSLFFMVAISIVLALFRGEEFSSGFIKNVYISYEHRFTLLITRWLMNFLVWILFWGVILLMIVLMNIFILHDPSLTTMNVYDYIMYCIIQMLIMSSAIAFIDFIIYLFRNKTIAVVVAIAYSSSFFYMIHMMIVTYLPSCLNYSSYTLTYAGGSLPMAFHAEMYGKAFLLAISSFILYTIGSNLLLKKKDLL